MRNILILTAFVALAIGAPDSTEAQSPFDDRGRGPGPSAGYRPGTGQGPGGEKVKLLKKFDRDENGWLAAEERALAADYLLKNPSIRRGPGVFGPEQTRGPVGTNPRKGEERPALRGNRRGFGSPGRFSPGRFSPGRPPSAIKPEDGLRISKQSVEAIEGDLYDESILRTVFVDFENHNWEQELETFHNTDVEVPATLTVDGTEYPNCGMRFRGMSSYHMIPSGYKRSFNVSVDMADDEQRILGYKTLNLLNGSGDSSMMSTVLYSHIARKYTAAPKANLVQVVINGEDWGIYTNVQQFNKDFLKENYGTSEGARWKVSGSPRGGGGLDYRGDDPAQYAYPYELKKGKEQDVEKLIDLCRVLDQSSPEQLPDELEKRVDVDELLWFLALDNGLINSDGYWIRASDYSIYLDEKDVFHFIPHDMNEAFRGAHGPGMTGPGGPRRGREERAERGPFPGEGDGRGRFNPNGEPPRDFNRLQERIPGSPFGPTRREGPRASRRPVADSAVASSPLELDPLIGLDDPMKPLRSKVLQVPQYRQQYLENLQVLARETLNWEVLGPFVGSQVVLIDGVMQSETHNLSSYEDFRAAVDSEPSDETVQPRRRRGPGHESMNLRKFIDGRHEYLIRKTDELLN